MSIRLLTAAAVCVALGLTVHGPVSAQQNVPKSAAKETMTPGGARNDVLYFWANHMGMLRGVQERDAIGTLHYIGTGTIRSIRSWRGSAVMRWSASGRASV